MPGIPFLKGQYDPRRAKGGARPNSGRPPNEFKRWIKSVIHNKKARKRFLQIINDHPEAEELVTAEGVCVPHRAKADTYLRAIEMGWHYVEGKPVQAVKNVDDEGNVVPVVVYLPEQNMGEKGKHLD